MDLYTRRKVVNGLNLGLSMAAMAFGLFWLAWILWTLFRLGLPWLSPEVLVRDTPPPGGGGGGLANAILGSLLITSVAVAIGTPVGILAATFLAEYGRRSRLAEVVRFVNDVLLSAPSIVLGMFVYEIAVRPMGHFSGWAGSLALACIVVPVVLRTTEDMLRLVPDSLREAAAALGAPRWWVVLSVTWPAAVAGITTGVLLAVARIGGETAPLLFTALNNQFRSLDMNAPIANLPVVIFQFAMSPYVDWQHLAWAGALLITLTTLGLNILSRALVRQPRSGR
jgi:phosphate transport system permease protein